ncbi:MAG: hypothetical protein K2X86_06870 [Cytophagaceae bacterium]|nr:hypothetical protein [Cytophagaceae bacterium]
MVLNYIWIFFFLIAFIVALIKLIFLGDTSIFPAIMNGVNVKGEMKGGLINAAKDGFDLALGLTSMLVFWLGIMKVGEKAGFITILAKLVGPFFHRLFPEVPKDHPAAGHILMNFSANMLGLDNAATPMGLKAMQGLQDLNPIKDTASNAQIMFLVLNTASLTIIPVGVMAARSRLGAPDPSDIFIPLLIASFCATLAAMVALALYQRINLLDKVIFAYLGAFTLLLVGIVYYFTSLPASQIASISSWMSNLIIFSIIILFITIAFIKRINVFEAFIEGAKEGFNVAVSIIPYLIALLTSIAVFRSCGALDFLLQGFSYVVESLGFNTDFVPAMSTAFMKPFSSGAAKGMAADTMNYYGVTSFQGKLASIFQGSSDTTFFILAVYFGSVGIKKTRHAAGFGLLADLFSIITSIWMAYIFFH